MTRYLKDPIWNQITGRFIDDKIFLEYLVAAVGGGSSGVVVENVVVAVVAVVVLVVIVIVVVVVVVVAVVVVGGGRVVVVVLFECRSITTTVKIKQRLCGCVRDCIHPWHIVVLQS
jgi:hypothetical protein